MMHHMGGMGGPGGMWHGGGMGMGVRGSTFEVIEDDRLTFLRRSILLYPNPAASTLPHSHSIIDVACMTLIYTAHFCWARHKYRRACHQKETLLISKGKLAEEFF